MKMVMARWILCRIARIWPVFITLTAIGFLMKFILMAQGPPAILHTVTQDALNPLPDRQAQVNKWVIIRAVVSGNLVIVCDDTIRVDFPGWTVLIISGDPHLTVLHSDSKCIYFDDEKVRSLGELNLSWLSEDRTVLACLYAIQNGAEKIWLHNDSVIDSATMIELTNVQPQHVGLVYHSREQLFHTMHHFGCEDKKKDKLPGNLAYGHLPYSICEHKAPALHVVATDTDSEQLQPPSGKGGTLCDPMSPPVTLQSGVFVDFVLQESFVQYDAMWMLILEHLEQSFPGKCRGAVFGLQHLMWLVGDRVRLVQLYHSGSQKRTSHLVPEEMKVITALNNWSCKSNGFFDCLLNLTNVLVSHQFVPRTFKNIMKEWVFALQHVGYRPPKIQATLEDCTENKALYQPVPQTQGQQATGHIPNLDQTSSLINHTCPKSRLKHKKITHLEFPKRDILLVITFNNAHYEAIPYIEALYRQFFPYILYCGPVLPQPGTVKNYNISFVAYGNTPQGHLNGSFNYMCSSLAVSMGFPVQGYLIMADDVLLNIHHVAQYAKNLVWFLPKKKIRIGEIRTGRECRLGMCNAFPHWHWWQTSQKQVMRVLEHLAKNPYGSPVVQQCSRQLVNLNGHKYRANGGYSDIYYIPKRISKSFMELAEIFAKYEVFLEIAVPTIITCLENPSDVLPLDGVEDWTVQRDQPWLYFSKLLGKAHLHPSKLGHIPRGSAAYRDYFCDDLLPYLYDRYGRMSKTKHGYVPVRRKKPGVL